MRLSDRSIGWLRYLHRKAHTEDNWSEFGHPHPHWDGQSSADTADDLPISNSRRMDLVDSSYAMGLMAHTTPAWIEPHVAVLDQLVERHTGWWAMLDTGATSDASAFDPNVSMLVLLGVRSMVDPSGVSDTMHTDMAEQVAASLDQSSAHREPGLLVGLAAAGLGLRLHDSRHGSGWHQRSFEPVWEETLAAVDGVWPISALFLAASQYPADTRRLFEAARASAGLDGELRPPLPAALGSALILAREWGMTELEQRLASAIEASCEPTWNDGEFTWGMGLGEPHPRGRLNAILATAEAGGLRAWERLSAAPLDVCPQVVDVDVANMALDRAEWIDGNLHLGLAPSVEDPTRSTSFRVVGAEPRMWDVHGIDNARIESRMSGLHVRVPMMKAEMTLIRSSY